MIKRLRNKFILVAMISVFCVLFIMITSINIWNYYSVSSNADNVLDLLYSRDGRFDEIHGPSEDNKSDPKPLRINPETPFETRYFSVKFGDVIVADVNNIAAVSESEAIDYANKIKDCNKIRGYEGVYRYLVADDGNFILFVDCAKQLDTANDFLKSSILISSIGLLAFFLLVLILSNYAIKPMVEGYNKQKRFITDANHELKTPLTIISANNEMIELTNGKSDATNAISKQISKMSIMIKNLSSLASLEETDKLKNKQSFSLTEALLDLTKSFYPVIIKNNLNIDTNISPDLVLKGDENLFRQALSIILENACKYAKSNIVIDAKKEGANICIIFENDVENVQIGKLDCCFERFYRSDEVRATNIPGSGIGLSIAKSIVELHKGKINAYGLKDNIFKIEIII